MEIDKRMIAVYNRYKQGSTQAERDTSEKILRKICLKAGISLEELEDSMKYNGMKKVEFKVTKAHDSLFSQIIAKITDRFDIRYNDSYSKTYIYYFVYVTKKEENEINKAYKFYKKKYNEELSDLIKKQKQIFASAFIHKHDLFKPTPTIKKTSTGKSGVDAEDLMRAMKDLSDGDFIPDNKTIG